MADSDLLAMMTGKMNPQTVSKTQREQSILLFYSSELIKPCSFLSISSFLGYSTGSCLLVLEYC